MPRGGHFGLWKPTPKDHYKSRWKAFYKRCYRPRRPGNMVDFPAPHDQASRLPDGVPSPWKLLYSLDNFKGAQDGPQRVFPADGGRYAQMAYRKNLNRFMQPGLSANSSDAVAAVLRCLDPGRRGGADSGAGHAETVRPWQGMDHPDIVPKHMALMLSAAAEEASPEIRRGGTGGGGGDASGPDFLEALKNRAGTSDSFPVRRLYQLCEEYELVWKLPPPPGAAAAGPRGRFPYIDEDASLMDDMRLQDILKLAYKTASRRHPKWKEISYENKKRHKQYLRRRAINQDEVKARMVVLRQALHDA